MPCLEIVDLVLSPATNVMISKNGTIMQYQIESIPESTNMKKEFQETLDEFL